MAPEAEQKIIELLQTTPGLTAGEVAKAMGAGTSATVERLKRLAIETPAEQARLAPVRLTDEGCRYSPQLGMVVPRD
jgi:hypothetical protein